MLEGLSVAPAGDMGCGLLGIPVGGSCRWGASLDDVGASAGADDSEGDTDSGGLSGNGPLVGAGAMEISGVEGGNAASLLAGTAARSFLCP